MILPVFSLYAQKLTDVTPSLIGLAIGIYGLTQAMLQIPFGMLSDKIGRKPVIYGGLALLAIGSIIAAMSHSIYGVILGRALQGTGAIGSTVMAFVADITPVNQRTKAMAIVGGVIGLAFSVAFVLGPVVSAYYDVSGIFWLTAGFALLGMGLLHPLTQTNSNQATQNYAKQLRQVLQDRDLLRLDAGIFMLHAALTALFIVLPLSIKHTLSLDSGQQWQLYLPVLLASFLFMFPFIIWAEKKGQTRALFLGSVGLLCLSQLSLWLADTPWTLIFSIFCFFTAFNLLEAQLPSTISKLAQPETKGTAMGVYSTAQFLGIFVGGTVGGWCYQQLHTTGVVGFTLLLSLSWLLLLAMNLGIKPLKSSQL